MSIDCVPIIVNLFIILTLVYVLLAFYFISCGRFQQKHHKFQSKDGKQVGNYDDAIYVQSIVLVNVNEFFPHPPT